MGAGTGPYRQVAVIGLGRFGLAVAEMLTRHGHEVLGIDRAEEPVQRAKDIVVRALQATLTDTNTVRELGLPEVDAAIVAIGSDIEANIVSTALLLEAGVPYVVARANSPLQGVILTRVGAHSVVYPEVASGEALARSLRAPASLGRLPLGPDVGISTVRTPADWVGRPLADLRLPEHGPFVVLAIQRGADTLAGPDGAERLREGDTLALLCREGALDALPHRQRR